MACESRYFWQRFLCGIFAKIADTGCHRRGNRIRRLGFCDGYQFYFFGTSICRPRRLGDSLSDSKYIFCDRL
jgi:hypothetical protein